MDTLLEIGFASLTVMQQQLLQQDMERVSSTAGITVQYIRPASPLPLTVLGFSNQDGINTAVAAGIVAAKAPGVMKKG